MLSRKQNGSLNSKSRLIAPPANSAALEARRRASEIEVCSNEETRRNSIREQRLSLRSRRSVVTSVQMQAEITESEHDQNEDSSEHSANLNFSPAISNQMTGSISDKINKLKESNNLALRLTMESGSALKRRVHSTNSESGSGMTGQHPWLSHSSQQSRYLQSNRYLNSPHSNLKKSVSSSSNVQSRPQGQDILCGGTALRTLSSNCENFSKDFDEILPISKSTNIGNRIVRCSSSDSNQSENEVKVSTVILDNMKFYSFYFTV